VQVAGVAWCAVMRIVVGVGDLVQRTEDGHTGRVLGVQTIERSDGAVCGLHRACGDMVRGFLGLASKPATTVFSSLASKLVVIVSPGLASKLAVSFLIEPQNQGGGEFLSLGLKTGSSGLMI
jgi:hypothetical protein